MMASITPSKLFWMSLFQNRRTRKPCSASQASRHLSPSLSECWIDDVWLLRHVPAEAMALHEPPQQPLQSLGSASVILERSVRARAMRT